MANILFFSNKCNYCSALIALLNKEKLSSTFNYINIDDNLDLPEYIKKVPTIMVENVTKPLIGKAAFNWIQIQSDINNKTNNINNISIDNFKACRINGPKGFTEKEMTGISDSFSFVAPDKDNDVKKSYNFIEDKAEDIFLPPDEVLSHRNQTKHLDKMMEQRNVQDKEFVEHDECDDIVDIAYNTVAYNTQSKSKGMIKKPDFTREPKKDNPVFIKKLNGGISGYNFMKF